MSSNIDDNSVLAMLIHTFITYVYMFNKSLRAITITLEDPVIVRF